jgi:DNA-binding transcriptional LysR family regulator
MNDINPLAGVDLNLLKVLDALLHEHSVTRAAQRLSLTQPTVSASLARLRVLFDDELLIKTGRTMRPTPFADALTARVRAALVEVESLIAARAEFDPSTDARTFRILATDYSTMILIRPLIALLANAAPHVRLIVDAGDPTLHGERLQRGELDLAIVPQWFTQTNMLPSDRLFTDRFVAAVWRDNDAVSDPMTFDELAKLPYLGYNLGPLDPIVDTVLAELGSFHEPDTTVESFVIGPMLLKRTRQVAFIQERLVELLGEFAELKAVGPPCEFPPIIETLTWHPRSTDDPAHAWLRAQLQTVAASLAPVKGSRDLLA